ncbi:hypothetical protein LRHMDP3_2404 [Lacticaseibacillus rhamnosus LRHMDP3]|uniref:Uncharacterized protein n=1 Tax=Lacticaseibacillus rhamnosus LRHMDP3 TaxID=1203259 RepID=A0AB33XSC0_LACRH|nr:hypothetical protein LRHMDP3_2404 [Lacticaseibacillus rhamnosus LRHMDP3]
MKFFHHKKISSSLTVTALQKASPAHEDEIFLLVKPFWQFDAIYYFQL